MHWQTSYLAVSQNVAEMAECLLVIQHNGRVREHTCALMLAMCGWLPMCVYLFKLALKFFFACFVSKLQHFPYSVCMSFCVIMVRCLFLEWLSLFVVEATFPPKSKLSWHNCLWAVGKGCIWDFMHACVVLVCVFVCVSMHAHGKRQSKEQCGGEIVWNERERKQSGG